MMSEFPFKDPPANWIFIPHEEPGAYLRPGAHPVPGLLESAQECEFCQPGYLIARLSPYPAIKTTYSGFRRGESIVNDVPVGGGFQFFTSQVSGFSKLQDAPGQGHLTSEEDPDELVDKADQERLDRIKLALRRSEEFGKESKAEIDALVQRSS